MLLAFLLSASATPGWAKQPNIIFILGDDLGYSELAGFPKAAPSDIDGVSFAPTLLGGRQDARSFLHREFPGYGGQQYVRIGDWKGVRQNLNPDARDAKPNMHIELYNLQDDPSETRDLSGERPDVVARIAKIMREQHTASKDFPFPALDNP